MKKLIVPAAILTGGLLYAYRDGNCYVHPQPDGSYWITNRATWKAEHVDAKKLEDYMHNTCGSTSPEH